MYRLTTISEEPNQNLIFQLDDGTSLSCTLSYYRGQRGWFYSIQYGELLLNSRRIVTSLNMLRQFRDIIPFGLACLTTDGLEPIFKNDFKSGRAALFFLNEEDIERVEYLIQNAEV